MKVYQSPYQLQKICLQLKRRNISIGLVPTMGYLHEGHLSLLTAAKKNSDRVILTLFVNPTQFGPGEDFSKYPRDRKRDLQLAKKAGVDFVFCPTRASMYPENFQTFVEVMETTRELCGRSRPGHFRGVATVVTKLFHITEPNTAYFGKKDFQQYAMIRQMVKDLHMPVKIVGCPIVREKNGLAMSSRNKYLSPMEHKSALCLFRGLTEVKRAVQKGQKNIPDLLRHLRASISSEKRARIDYVACVDADSISPIKAYKKNKTLFAVAVYFGKTRLLDNVVV